MKYLTPFLAALLLTACAVEGPASPDSDIMSYMPANPDFAMVIDQQAMYSKVDFEAILQHETYTAFFEGNEDGLMSMQEVFLLEGLDRNQEVIAYGGADDVVHMVAGIADQAAFSDAVELLGFTMQKVEGLQFGVSEDATIVYSSDMLQFFSAKKSPESITEWAFNNETEGEARNAEFSRFLSRSGEARFWIDSDNLNDILNVTGKFFTGFDGMDAGIFIDTEGGLVEIDIQFYNVDAGQQQMFEELFASSTTLSEYIPNNTPLFVDMAVTPIMASKTDGALGKLMAEDATEMLLAFDGIDISFSGVQPKMSFRMEGESASAIVDDLRKNGAIRAGGKINLLGYGADYRTEGKMLTGSVKSDIDLSKKPAEAFAKPSDLPAGFDGSPLKIFIDANATASRLSMKQLDALEHLAIFLEQDEEGTHLRLHGRSDDPEKSGLNEVARVLLDLYPFIAQFIG